MLNEAINDNIATLKEFNREEERNMKGALDQLTSLKRLKSNGAEAILADDATLGQLQSILADEKKLDKEAFSQGTESVDPTVHAEKLDAELGNESSLVREITMFITQEGEGGGNN